MRSPLELIPADYREHWELVTSLPPLLVHYTPAKNADKIFTLGFIQPMDPKPNDWAGLVAVFTCHRGNAYYEAQMHNILRDHFMSKARMTGDTNIDALYIDTAGWDSKTHPFFRCKQNEKGSSYITLSPIPVSRIRREEGVMRYAMTS